jgi:hypothetical protein
MFDFLIDIVPRDEGRVRKVLSLLHLPLITSLIVSCFSFLFVVHGSEQPPRRLSIRSSFCPRLSWSPLSSLLPVSLRSLNLTHRSSSSSNSSK